MQGRLFNRAMLTLLAATFFYMTSIMMLGPIMAGFCAALGGSGVAMGLVAGLSNFSSLLCRPLTGGVIDRCDRRKVGLFGLGCMALGASVCGLAPNVWVLMCGRVFTGVGYAVSSGTLSTWVASSLPREHVGQGMGLYGVVAAVAQAISPAFGLALAGRLSYRASCAAAAVCAVGGMLLILPLHDAHYHPAPRERAPRKKQPLFVPELLPVACIILLFCMPYNGTSAFLATIAADRGLTFSVGSFFTIYAVLLLAVRCALSRVLDALPFRKFVLLAIPFGVGSMLCLHFMHSFGMMVAAAFLLTMAYGMMQPVCQAAGIRSVGAERHGVANCTYYIGLDIGLAFGPTLSGALYSVLGEEKLFLVLAAVPVLSLAVLAAGRRTFDRLGL